MTDGPALVVAAAGAGVAGGLFLLARGLLAYRAGEPVRGTGTSRIESLAAGEVRLVGTIAPGPVTLVSPLQSVPCVYYHARIVEDRGRERTTTLDDERAVGFLLRDGTGTLRVFPRGARWDAPTCFDEQTDWAGDDPPGLNLNRGRARRWRRSTGTPRSRHSSRSRARTAGGLTHRAATWMAGRFPRCEGIGGGRLGTERPAAGGTPLRRAAPCAG